MSTLTDGQQQALDAAMEAIRTKTHLVISGPAGSGKTFLTKEIVDKMNQRCINYILAAPTHQAKVVLAKTVGFPARTIHSVLRIHPETYEDTVEFKQKEISDQLKECQVLIVDEASMIDDELYAIIMGTIPRGTIVLAIGDEAQIQPVRHMPGYLSPFFRKDSEIKKVKLTETVRQAEGNPIIEVATKIRQGGWIYQKFDRESKTGVIKTSGIGKMIETYLGKIKTPEDLLDYRFLAYTNEVVNKINGIIRAHVYKTDEPFVVDEYLVLQEPVSRTTTDDEGNEVTEILLHNGEIVKILDVKKETYTISLPMVSMTDINIGVITCARVYGDITEVTDDEPVEFKVLWDADAWFAVKESLKSAAAEYKAISGGKGVKSYWKKFWEVKGTFTDTKSLGACTFHKSQGTTVTGCCIVTSGLHNCDVSLQEQLLYVGVTRAKKWVLYC